MPIVHIALVPEADDVDRSEVSRVAAALQKQVTRDFSPLWGVSATVDSFLRLEDLPLGYWPIVLTRRALDAEEGFHLSDRGEPYSIVELVPSWSLTASHECLEMLVDPSGNWRIPGPAPGSGARVEYLLEICDPCQSAAHGYTVNDVLVSDFATRAYFEPAALASERYSYKGSLLAPRTVASGGSLSWFDPRTGKYRRQVGPDLGAIEDVPVVHGAASGRERAHAASPQHRASMRLNGLEHALLVHAKRASSVPAARARAASLRAEIGRFGEAPAVVRSIVRGPDAKLAAEIDDVVAKVRARAPGDGSNDAIEKQLIEALQEARKQLDAERPFATTGDSEPYLLCLLRSAVAAPIRAGLLTGHDVVGFHEFEDLDVRWAESLAHFLTHKKIDFPVCPEAVPPDVELVHPLGDKPVLGLAADWGTRLPSSTAIAERMHALRPTHTIHLGDVYYSGAPGEEHTFKETWTKGSVQTFALNSNHDMYSGGDAYFLDVLQDSRFAGRFSYFALTNDDWLIIGLDSAYNAADHGLTPYDVGHLHQPGRAADDPQINWLRRLVGSRHATGPGGASKRVLVLTHHQGQEMSGATTALYDEVKLALGRAPDLWYWGHIHGAAVFKPVDGICNGRLIGHGGIPYVSDPKTDAMIWTEERPPSGQHASRNGFAVLTFDGASVTEAILDDQGNQRWSNVL